MIDKRITMYRNLWQDIVLMPKAEPPPQPKTSGPDQLSNPVGKNVVDLKQILTICHAHPLISVTELYKKAGMGAERGNRIKALAVRLKLATEQNIQKEQGKGRPLTCLVPTERGYLFLGVRGPEAGKGGIIHRIVQQVVRWRLKKSGLAASVELTHSGKSVDVGFFLKGLIWAVEVVVTTVNIEHTNLVKDLEAGFDRVVFIALDTRVQKTLADTLKNCCDSESWKKVHICLLEDFFTLVNDVVNSTGQSDGCV